MKGLKSTLDQEIQDFCQLHDENGECNRIIGQKVDFLTSSKMWNAGTASSRVRLTDFDGENPVYGYPGELDG